MPAAPRSAAVSLEIPVKPASTISKERANSTLDLLGKAYALLSERKRQIEAELNRFDDLRKELGTVNTQVEALKNTVTLFGIIERPEGSVEADEAGSVEKENAELSITEAGLEFTGNKRDFVTAIVESRGSEGITPKELETVFSKRKIARGRNLIYNALSSLVKQGRMKRDEGRYFSLMPEKATHSRK